MTMITPSYLGETIEYSSLHACRSTLEDPTGENATPWGRRGWASFLEKDFSRLILYPFLGSTRARIVVRSWGKIQSKVPHHSVSSAPSYS